MIYRNECVRREVGETRTEDDTMVCQSFHCYDRAEKVVPSEYGYHTADVKIGGPFNGNTIVINNYSLANLGQI